jgi:hypothetical protein
VAEESAEVALRSLAVFGDDEDAWLATLDPGFIWYPLEEGHIPSHGHEGARQIRNRWLESWEDLDLVVEESAGEGEGAITVIRLTGRGKRSGVVVDLRLYMQWKVVNGKLTYLYEHAERTPAFEAAGIADPAS